MSKRKILYKKPNEEIDKIITSIDIDNFKRAVKGEVEFIKISEEGYYLIVNKDSNKEHFLYNITVGIKTSEKTKYIDVFGNLLIVKLNSNGAIVDLTEEDILNLAMRFFFRRN